MNGSAASIEDQQMAFETKAIFTMADFLKQLSPNEYYDIAQKLYNEWMDEEVKQTKTKMRKVIEIKERLEMASKVRAFYQWKYYKDCFSLIEENQNMKEYI